jgi:hypothetical protein
LIVRWKRDAKEAVGVISHPIGEQIHIREMIVKNLALNLPEEIEKKNPNVLNQRFRKKYIVKS